jgi:hypothetical protein
MHLLEVQLLVRSVQRAPVPHPTLQRPQMRRAEPSGLRSLEHCQRTPDSRPVVSSIGGQVFPPDRGPVVSTR